VKPPSAKASGDLAERCTGRVHLKNARVRAAWWRISVDTAPAEERDRAMACLERVGLAEKAVETADSLSGGQQQRVAIARMLMQEPQVELADPYRESRP
jgi:ABC-type phosphate/phosphonate transport system ATPase subunit